MWEKFNEDGTRSQKLQRRTRGFLRAAPACKPACGQGPNRSRSASARYTSSVSSELPASGQGPQKTQGATARRVILDWETGQCLIPMHVISSDSSTVYSILVPVPTGLLRSLGSTKAMEPVSCNPALHGGENETQDDSFGLFGDHKKGVQTEAVRAHTTSTRRRRPRETCCRTLRPSSNTAILLSGRKSQRRANVPAIASVHALVCRTKRKGRVAWSKMLAQDCATRRRNTSPVVCPPVELTRREVKRAMASPPTTSSG